jgi:hypothetical protein
MVGSVGSRLTFALVTGACGPLIYVKLAPN